MSTFVSFEIDGNQLVRVEKTPVKELSQDERDAWVKQSSTPEEEQEKV